VLSGVLAMNERQRHASNKGDLLFDDGGIRIHFEIGSGWYHCWCGWWDVKERKSNAQIPASRESGGRGRFSASIQREEITCEEAGEPGKSETRIGARC
jgi:hypothetical protein